MKQFAENEVTIKSLVEVFNNAFIKIVEEEEDSFRIQGENLKVSIDIDEERKFLRLGILYAVEKIGLAEAAMLVNKVNLDYIYIRFGAAEYKNNIYIQSNYYMSYEEGLFAFQLINNVKKFEKFTVDALREYFNDYL